MYFRQKHAPWQAALRLLLPCVFIWHGTGGRSLRAEVSASEYELKAAFLCSFASSVTWPAGALPAGSPFIIGVLGGDSFGGALDKAAAGKNVGGRKISIRRSRQIEDLKGCQIVFVSKSEAGRIGGIVGGFDGTSALLVGESDGFTAQGGMIGFIPKGDKVRFKINNGAARQAGLTIGAQLLRLAE